MKNFLIGVVITALVISGVFYFYKSNNSSNNNGDVSNYPEKYESDGFSFYHPEGWKGSYVDRSNPALPEQVSIAFLVPEKGFSDFSAFVNIYNHPINLVLQELNKNKLYLGDKEFKSVDINGITWRRFYSTIGGKVAPNLSAYYMTEVGDRTYYIAGSPYETQIILSSIEFE